MITGFEHPFTLNISGPTGSDKSSFSIKLLQNLDSGCTERDFDGGVLWCYREKNAGPAPQVARLRKKIIYHEYVPDDNFYTHSQGRPILLLLDDFLQSVYINHVSVLFTRDSHHRNISVILITKDLFHQNRHSRDISLNEKHLMLLKNVGDKNQFSYLARKVLPEDSKGLYKAYLDATLRPHGYLLLDLSLERRPLQVSNQYISIRIFLGYLCQRRSRNT
jgi:hypothetical protein